MQPDPHQARPEGGAPGYLTLERLYCSEVAAANGFCIVSGPGPSRERYWYSFNNMYVSSNQNKQNTQ